MIILNQIKTIISVKKTLLFFLILFTQLTLVAKDGYIINFETKNLQGKTIEISHYYGSSRIFYSKNIVAISENEQSVSVKENAKILGGIYKINFIGQKNYKDIIIDNGDSLSFSIDGIDIANLTVLNSEKNKLFFLYPSIQNDSIISTFLSNHSKSVGSLFFKLEAKRRNVPAYYSKRAEYQRTFWDSIDLKNDQLRYLPNIYKTLNLFNELQPINDSLYSRSMNQVLNQVETNSDNFEFYLTWYFKNMRYQQLYYLDNTFINTYKKYFDTLNIEFKNLSSFRSIERTYDDVFANKKGEVISDFNFLDSNDSTYTLSKIYPNNDYTLIAFYDPYCSHCQKAMPKISLLFSELKATSGKKIETIGMLNAYEKEGWKEFIVENNMINWINLYSKDPNKEYQEDFNSYSNPRFFLVDRNGILVSRSGDTKILYSIIKQ